VIVRVLTAHVAREQVGQFNDLIRGELQELRTQAGLVYAKLARRLDDRGGEEVVLFEEWATPADLFEWTGGRLTQPRLLPGTEELIEDLVVTHFEALDMDVGEVDLRPITDARATLGRGLVPRDVGEAPA
jgi:heme-degrading monooxygenase HmoA